MTLPLMFLPLLLLQTPAPMPRPVTVVAEVNKGDKLPPAVWTEIPADPILTTLMNPVAAKWIAVDDGCELRPAADGKSCVFAAAKAGRYRVIVVPETGEIMRVAVVVGKIDPVPPPIPPGPAPPPVSELGKKLQAAYDGDKSLTLAEKIKVLADKIELYRQAADLADSPDVPTLGVLVARVKSAGDALHTGLLPDVRKVIRDELAATFPVDVPLTAELRKKAREKFIQIQNALKEVK